jgi:hypothetical protein
MSDVAWVLLIALLVAAGIAIAAAPGLRAMLAREQDLQRRVDNLESLRLLDAADRSRLNDEMGELRRGLAILIAQLRRSNLTPEWSPPSPAAPPVAGRQQRETERQVWLWQLVAVQFALDEQADLWFQMGWANWMRGDSAGERARELVAFAYRRGGLDELVALCRRERPEGGF